MSAPRNRAALERLALRGWRVVLKYAFLHVVVYGIPRSAPAKLPAKRSTAIRAAAAVTVTVSALITALLSAHGWWK